MKKKATYEYIPFTFSSQKIRLKDSNLLLNFSLKNSCNDSIGIRIFLSISFYYNLSLCIKPFGEIVFK